MKKVVLALLLVIGAISATAYPDGRSAHLSARQASSHIGEYATVCGKVVSTKYADRSNGRPTFLNLDRAYPNHIFTVVIWGDDRAAFGKPERTYSGKRACVKGPISRYQGRAQIVATAKEQLWLDR